MRRLPNFDHPAKVETQPVQTINLKFLFANASAYQYSTWDGGGRAKCEAFDEL